MTFMQFLALLLIVGGVFALLYSHFTYTPIDITIKEEGRQTVYIPTWAGILAIGAGSLFLLL
jgi:hypothetical protein